MFFLDSSLSNSALRGSHGLSGRRGRRTKSSRPKAGWISLEAKLCENLNVSLTYMPSTEMLHLTSEISCGFQNGILFYVCLFNHQMRSGEMGPIGTLTTRVEYISALTSLENNIEEEYGIWWTTNLIFLFYTFFSCLFGEGFVLYSLYLCEYSRLAKRITTCTNCRGVWPKPTP